MKKAAVKKKLPGLFKPQGAVLLDYRDCPALHDAVHHSGPGPGRLLASLLAGLLEVAASAYLLHQTFFVHYFLQAPQRLVHGLASLYLYLDH